MICSVCQRLEVETQLPASFAGVCVLGLIMRCHIYTFSLSEVFTTCLLPLVRDCRDPPAAPQQRPSPVVRNSQVLPQTDDCCMPGIPVLVYNLQDGYLGELWIYLGLSFAERNKLLFFPNKIRPQLAIVWDSSTTNKIKASGMLPGVASQALLQKENEVQNSLQGYFIPLIAIFVLNEHRTSDSVAIVIFMLHKYELCHWRRQLLFWNI